MTPYSTDFVGKVTPANKLMNGLGVTAKITGEGYAVWKFRDDFAVEKRVKVKAYLVSASKVRLFSPQSYFRAEGGGEFSMDTKGSTFTFANSGTLPFNYVRSMLPIAEGSIRKELSSAGYLGSTGHKNISKAQEELLLRHATFGHYNILTTQKLMNAVGVNKEPLLMPKEPGVVTCSIPMCTACLRGKG